MFVDTPDNLSMPAATVIPVLEYADVAAAVAWLCAAFGFTERLRIGTHRVQLNVGSGAVVVTMRGRASSPSGQTLMIRVRDVDGLFDRLSEFNADIVGAPETYPYGERQLTVRDIGGHVWTFSQAISDVAPSVWGGELVHP